MRIRNEMKKPKSGEFRTSTETGTAYISGFTFDRKKVTYHVVDGLAIFEGDIVLGTVEELKARTAVATPGNRWSEGLIPYEIDPNLPNPQRVTDAMSHWRSKTNIHFRKHSPGDISRFPNYIRFQPTVDGCAAVMVGMHAGRNDIFLCANCTTGNVIHEIGHAVGLWHEQSREDRNQFVTIHYENMSDNDRDQFDQHITDGDDIGGYDYCSIMHYPANAFSNNGMDTIQVLQPTQPCGTSIGQRTGLSAGDIAAVNSLYPPLPDPVTVPDVVGADGLGARLAIRRAGLIPSITGPPRNSRVDSQQPEGGTRAPRWSTVRARLV